MVFIQFIFSLSFFLKKKHQLMMERANYNKNANANYSNNFLHKFSAFSITMSFEHFCIDKA